MTSTSPLGRCTGANVKLSANYRNAITMGPTECMTALCVRRIAA